MRVFDLCHHCAPDEISAFVVTELLVRVSYLYGASARAAAAISGSHLSPIIAVSDLFFYMFTRH